MPRKASSPAQTQRAALAKQLRDRGESAHNIWIVRPPFETEDLILSSDPTYELFYFLEGDARYVEISYALLRSPAEPVARHADLPFAYVTSAIGVRSTVLYKRGIAPKTEANAIYVDLRTLSDHRMRIENWRKIVPCIRRVLMHPIATLKFSVLNLTADGKPRSLRELRSQLRQPSTALCLGAIATLLRERKLACDCDIMPWSWHTLVWQVSP